MESLLVAAALACRVEILFLIEVVMANLNGDPENGNLPRQDPLDGHGFATGVCIKRRIRNFAAKVANMELFFRNGSYRNVPLLEAFEATGGVPTMQRKKKNKTAGSSTVAATSDRGLEVRDWLCKKYWDIRTFGAVLSGAPPAGAITGPVQIAYARSLDPVQPMESQLSVQSISDKTLRGDGSAQAAREWEKEQPADELRTFGRFQYIPYGLYLARAFVSPSSAAVTGFTEADLTVVLKAIKSMYEVERTGSKGFISVRQGWVFRHTGTGPETESIKNQRLLGCAPAYKVFDSVESHLKLKSGVEFPRKYADYQIPDIGTVRSGLPKGVEVSEL